MASGYTRNPAAGPQLGADPRKKRAPRLTEANAQSKVDASPLQFVTTTSTVVIDELSKKAIRKHASRYVYRSKPQPFQGGKISGTDRRVPKGASGGQVHRFRLGSQGLKHTPNQPPQVSQKFEIFSVKGDEESEAKPKIDGTTSVLDGPFFGQGIFESPGSIFEEDGEEQVDVGLSFGNFYTHSGGIFRLRDSFELIQHGKRHKVSGLNSLLFPRGGSLFGPSSGTMDPFNAMALPITPREQVLLRYYYTSSLHSV